MPADTGACAVSEKLEQRDELVAIQIADGFMQAPLWFQQVLRRKWVINTRPPRFLLEGRQNCFLAQGWLPEALDNMSTE